MRQRDTSKIPWDLVPWGAVTSMAEIVAFGAFTKYAPEDWRANVRMRDHVRAAIGHSITFLRGDHFDEETGKCHLAHAMCRIAMALELFQGDKAAALPDDPLPAAQKIP